MILSFTPGQAERDIQQFADLLIDAVASGASVGFMPPLAQPEAFSYWRGVIAAMRDGSRILLVSADGDLIQGSVQIDLETRANGNHRAEAIKLFVHRCARRRGLAKALMAELESIARNMGRTLLLTDTRKGGEAEKMCEALGYVKFGEVPNYARTGDGRLNTSSFFYKEL
ncbi:MAG TPA: GNAT family N-acetyltransferase [Bryobacteraceae bacterium]